MVDLYFCDQGERKKFTCQGCGLRAARKCDEPGFTNLVSPLGLGPASLKYPFCPGKATWYPEITALFMQCQVAYKTGIMPQAGGLEDQSELFAQVFPAFVERWGERVYNRVWADTNAFVNQVLKAIFGDGKKG